MEVIKVISMQEKWKEIENYPNYQISNFGRVKSLKYYSNIHKKYYDRELILKEKNNKHGYKFVSKEANCYGKN